MLGQKIIAVVLDNRGFSCINRLQNATGNRSFNNLLKDCNTADDGHPEINFALHAKSLGANSEHVENITELASALKKGKGVIKVLCDKHSN